MAWWHYDTTYRKEMGANHLNYGQINWDFRFRCLERASNKPGAYPFRGNQSRNTHVKSRSASSGLGKGFQKGQCYQFEQFASCAKPAGQFKQACAKCSGKHPTSRCTARPHGAGTGHRVEASFLVQGFACGFSLHYDGPQHVRFSGNHQSALQATTVVDEKIRHEVDLGRVAGPFRDITFVKFQSSPLGLVPKHDPGKYRLIHDLSFPKGDSINAYTAREYSTIQYESLDRVVELVRSCGLNSLIATADIRDAF